MNIKNIKKIDNFLDYVPVVSTISNIVNMVAKMVFGQINKESINNFSYFFHVSEKSYFRCMTLLVPVIGNIAVFLYDITTSNSSEDVHIPVQLDNVPSITNTEDELQKNQSTDTLIIKNNLSNRDSIISTNSNSSEEKLIDSIQQTIKDNYKEFENKKKGQSNLSTTSTITPNLFVPPRGINNNSKNCWCISVLQILCNTPLYNYIMSSDRNLQIKFPKLFQFIRTYKEQSNSSEQLGKKFKEIRLEINQSLNKNFPLSEEQESDAIYFMMELLEKLNLDYHLAGITASSNEEIKDEIITREEPCIFIEFSNTSNIELDDIDEIFDSTSYELVAALRTEPAHYSSIIKAKDDYWYKCNDAKVSKLLKTFQPASLKDDQRIFLVGYRKNVH